ncbi:conserved protein of unknown function [Mesotoga infera]|uniref:DUF4230 domain-containing protein n=1 Tax=Mesotoga infera TaxID=1236046 RepID=A0A7Z7PNS8_9BACT|nr:DUF4230 domain-containing protein [Mesotoga infera]SSC12270.1 conserved protein of unknown function [Mesotoga infera]HNS67400.1 DUF4230 domain-containing protein [Mesotoga infera]HOI35645.1 DUF4230 domain-containing protein [Mesotoga infera]
MLILLQSRKKTTVRTESVIHRIERIAELSTARMTTLLIFEPEKESIVPGTSQRYIFIVPFQVRGYLDLKSIDSNSIEIYEGESRRIKLVLPPPELEVTIPQSKIPDIRVINQSGVLVKVFGNRDMLKTFQSYSKEIEQQALISAQEMGIEETSRESAKNFFHGLLLGMGFDEVVVLFKESERPQSLRESPNPVIR